MIVARDVLIAVFNAALSRVNGKTAVALHLRELKFAQPVAALAVGKAATAMMEGAVSVLGQNLERGLVITKQGYGRTISGVKTIESAHPVPDQTSLDAGTEMVAFLQALPMSMPLIIMVSGGASALVEKLPSGMQLDDLQKLNQWLLASGLDIHTMNRVRQAFSTIKGGRALRLLGERQVVQFLISDVPADDPSLIGSGMFVTTQHQERHISLPGWLLELQQRIQPGATESVLSVDTQLVATNTIACQAACEQATQMGLSACWHADMPLSGDVSLMAKQLSDYLKAAPCGVHIWGGETTVVLPDQPGRGGRNQSLALMLACELEKEEAITVLVAGTDGSDGPTDDAGAIVDNQTLQRAADSGLLARECLLAADAGTFLAEAGDLLSTGPTGTNVMDMVIALKKGE